MNDSKASALARLRGRLTCSSVLPQHRLSRQETVAELAAWWLSAPDWVKHGALILRSNHAEESMDGRQHAGRYRSVGQVAPNLDAVRLAAQEVFDSYGGREPNQDLFVQPMIEDARWSGVVTTRDRESGAPYFVIEESAGKSTSRVTGGRPGHITLTRWPNWRPRAGAPSERHQALIAALCEARELLGLAELEMEYAFESAVLPVILQVRPLVFEQPRWSDERFRQALEEARERAASLSTPEHAEVGTGVFSVMSDWNPAEIIGRKPKPLAVSLYRHFFTDRVWTEARQGLGYADPGPGPLMRLVGGTPYIDVARSFHSLLPAGLPDALSRALVRHWMAGLREHPDRHDSVELRLVLSAYTVGTPGALRELELAGFDTASTQSLGNALKGLTNELLRPGGRVDEDLALIAAWLSEPGTSRLGRGAEDTDIARQIQRCRDVIAPLFVRLARYAYVAVAQFEALLARGVWGEDEMDGLYREVRSVEALLNDAGQNLRERFAHLRPSTYDIESPCWSDRSDWLPRMRCAPVNTVTASACRDRAVIALARALDVTDWGLDASDLLDRCIRAIEGREAGKFLFSFHLSKLLESVAVSGSRRGFSRRQIAMLDLEQALALCGEEQSGRRNLTLAGAAGLAERRYVCQRAISMPDLLSHPDQVLGFTQHSVSAHFLGQGVVEGRTLSFTGQDADSLRGAIVILESADPGHDFLFRLGVRALVTCYGGLNSHMAVRCRESGVPGVLGVGPALFRQLRQAGHVTIDMESRRIVMDRGGVSVGARNWDRVDSRR